MKNNRKIFPSSFLLLISIVCLFSNPAWAKDTPPSITGKYGSVIDAVTGEVLYSKHAEQKAYPASITKVMTAILLDEKMKDNQMLTVSENAASQDCICYGLKAGEKISKKDAMYGMLLLSANDLATAIAENVGGSVKGFARLMNEEAKKWGLKHTHFVTPNGLHDPDHYTTAHDMALIMKETLKHPEVLDAMSTQSILVHTSLENKWVISTSKVHIQHVSAHVISGKNGYTDQAGHTLVEYLKDGEKELIAVVMKTNKKNQYEDIQTMADYTFSHMTTKMIAAKGKAVKKTRINGTMIQLIAAADLKIALKNNDFSHLRTRIDLVNTNGKDIKKGQTAANLNILDHGRIVKKVPLLTNKEIPKTTVHRKINILSIIFTGILLMIVILVPSRIRKIGKKRRKYAENH